MPNRILQSRFPSALTTAPQAISTEQKVTSEKLISIVIPNWNGKHYLADCLDSIRKQTHKSIETIIVDNGSHDGSVEFLKTNYPEVKLITFEVNTGFSPAVNAGIRAATGSYIALLNNDTIIEPLWVEELVKGLDEHPEVGSVGCKMLAYDDQTILDGVGDGYRRGGLPGRIGHKEKDEGRFDTQRYILGACGGAAMYRRELFDDIGLFDDDYFAYLEDVDLGLRAQSAGYKCLYIPTAIVYHLGCGTTGSGYSAMVVKLSAQNNFNTIVKNIPMPLLLKFLPHIFYWQAFYLAVVTIRGGQLVPWLIGTGKGIGMLPKMLKKRAEINRKRKTSLEYFESIIIESERDLTEAKARLYAKARLEKKEAALKAKLEPRDSKNKSGDSDPGQNDTALKRAESARHLSSTAKGRTESQPQSPEREANKVTNREP
ncbi:MAG: glycosyltransferase family 2 protein [Candidatus Melainabacteria bacterium]|nr:glycosyltransferase family 2 protein [Candidatus Melainabacteria bacterium]